MLGEVAKHDTVALKNECYFTWNVSPQFGVHENSVVGVDGDIWFVARVEENMTVADVVDESIWILLLYLVVMS